MAFMNYLLVLLGSYSGLILGSLLAIIAKEEMQNGRKYLFYLQRLIFFIILFMILLFFDFSIAVSAIITVISAFIVGFFKLFRMRINLILYPVYGILAYLLSLRAPYDLLFPSLVFLYGLPTGSLLTNNKKDMKKNAWIHASYIVLGLLAYAVFNLI